MHTQAFPSKVQLGQSAPPEGMIMAKGQKKSNKEARKPKANKKKASASAPSTRANPGVMVTIKD